MAASTTSREAARKPGDIIAYPVKAGAKINKGTGVFVDTTVGYAIPARSGTTTDAFVGVAFESVDNTSGASGAVNVRVEKQGTFVFPKASAVQTDVTTTLYWADDQTLTATATNNQAAGTVVGLIDSATVRLRLGSVK